MPFNIVNTLEIIVLTLFNLALPKVTSSLNPYFYITPSKIPSKNLKKYETN